MLSTMEEFKATANKVFKQKRYEEAAGLYTRAVHCGQAAAGSEAAEGVATEDVQKLLAQCLSNRAACHLKMKDFPSAAKDCGSALEQRPGYARALARRATALESMGDRAAAVADQRAILALPTADPDSKECAVAREALLRLQQGPAAGLALAQADATLSPATPMAGHDAAGQAGHIIASTAPPAVACRPTIHSTPAATRAAGGGGGGGSDRGFDESRLLRDGEWQEFEKLMESDAGILDALSDDTSEFDRIRAELAAAPMPRQDKQLLPSHS